MTTREVKTLTVGDAEAGIRLDRWFKRRWPHRTHVQRQKLFRSGQVRVDGSRAKADTRLEVGAVVRVPPLPDAQARGEGGRDRLPRRDHASGKSLVPERD